MGYNGLNLNNNNINFNIQNSQRNNSPNEMRALDS